MCKDLTLISLQDIPVLVPFFILENEAGETIKFLLPEWLNNTADIPRKFITEKQFLYEEEQKKLLEEQRLAQEKARQKKSREAKEAFRQECIAKYGERLGVLISEHKVVLGMNQEMCLKAWGKPYRKAKVMFRGSLHEVWEYDWNHALYFQNGILMGMGSREDVDLDKDLDRELNKEKNKEKDNSNTTPILFSFWEK